MLADPLFQAAKCEAAHADHHDEEVIITLEHTTIVVNRWMVTDGMPGVVKSVIGPRLHIHETYVWHVPAGDGSRRGELTASVGATPLRLHAKIALAPVGSDTHMAVDGELRAHMFMGGQVERLAAPWIMKGMDKEEETAAAWLTG